jgi:ubiquinone/menaquinone biosynthesis C-methylase UbiE
MIWAWLALAAAGALGFYWLFVIAEGTYLGSRVVAWTYDLVAGRYDAIKQFNPVNESWFVAGPLLRAMGGVKKPLVLDVATGTGRLPLALLGSHFASGGQIVGLDLSRGMLRRARAKLEGEASRVSLVWQDAGRLPFEDGVFDAVACLESLEFMSRPRAVLAEMVRVLAPGGVLLLTNRVGREARLLPGRAFSRPDFEQALTGLSLEEIDIRRWQVNYDLAIARKRGAGRQAGAGGVELTSLVRCPACLGRMEGDGGGLTCLSCRRFYAIRDGIVCLAESKEQGRR